MLLCEAIAWLRKVRGDIKRGLIRRGRGNGKSGPNEYWFNTLVALDLLIAAAERAERQEAKQAGYSAKVIIYDERAKVGAKKDADG